jgi:hypothetical protein
MKLKNAILICLVISAAIAVPMVVGSAFAQEVNVDTQFNFYVEAGADGGTPIVEPQGLPIDNPGGPT